MDGLITFVAPFLFGALIIAIIWFLVNRYSDNSSKPKKYGTLTFTQINEDEAKVEFDIDQYSWADVMNSDEVIFKVVRKE